MQDNGIDLLHNEVSHHLHTLIGIEIVNTLNCFEAKLCGGLFHAATDLLAEGNALCGVKCADFDLFAVPVSAGF